MKSSCEYYTDLLFNCNVMCRLRCHSSVMSQLNDLKFNKQTDNCKLIVNRNVLFVFIRRKTLLHITVNNSCLIILYEKIP